MKTVVLGGGIVGLWTAYALTKRGADITVVAKSRYGLTTSAAAVAVLTPFLPSDPRSSTFAQGLAWAKRTLTEFQSLDGVSQALEPMTCFEFGLDGILEDGFPVTKLESLDFTQFTIHDLGRVIHECNFAVEFVCQLCNTQVFLEWITEELERRGVRFVERELKSPDEVAMLGADFVFNCMGYQSIFPDKQLFAVHGQSIFVPSVEPPADLFGLGAGHHAVFAHRRGYYVGSYFLPGENFTPRRDLWDQSTSFLRGDYPDLCESVGRNPAAVDLTQATRVNTGIRPFRRDGPRVELDLAWGTPVIHNYGHGAHGWTLGFATSEDAVNLALDGGNQ